MGEYLNKLVFMVEQYPSTKTVLFSLFNVCLLFLIKKIVLSNLNRRDVSKSERILFKKKIDQYFRYILLFSLVLLWFAQLQVFLVSLIAIAAAIVIAFKELIMCLTGGIFLKSSKIYKEGHRIDVNGHRGYVIEVLLLSTKILELGPEKYSQQTTGDVIALPNSLVLTHAVKNQSYFRGYSIKSFYYRVLHLKDLEELEAAFLKKATDLCADYLEEAEKGISRFCEREGLLIPSIFPRTKVLIEDDNEIGILVKMPVKNTQIADTEQEMNRFYLKYRMEKEV